VVLLDEPRATQNLMGRFAEDAVVFEVVRDHLLDAARSDQSPDALLLASATLVTGGLRPFAVQLLDAASRDVLTEPRGRAKVLASLARCLLDEGRPADALPIARSLVADAKDDAARDRAELLLCSALTASGEADRLAEAEPRLVALRAAKRLDAASEFEAAATLGDCLLRRDDALAALAVLDVDAEGAAAPVRLRITTLRQDALARVARDRAAVLALVAALGGPGGDDARARLWAMSGRAAFHVSRELETASDPADIRRLLAAAAVVTGGEAAPLPADASAERVAAAVAAARRALAAVPIDAKRPER
jgi:hypothetical protein